MATLGDRIVDADEKRASTAADAQETKPKRFRLLDEAEHNLEAGTIRWRAETDRKGYERVYPVADSARGELAAWRRKNPAIGEA